MSIVLIVLTMNSLADGTYLCADGAYMCQLIRVSFDTDSAINAYLRIHILQVNVVLVGVQDKLPEGPAGAAIRAVFIDTFAAEWTARLQLLAVSFSTLSARCVQHNCTVL
jgi:hypothetical protein